MPTFFLSYHSCYNSSLQLEFATRQVQPYETLRFQTLMANYDDSCTFTRWFVLTFSRIVALIRAPSCYLQPDNMLRLQTLMVECVVTCTFARLYLLFRCQSFSYHTFHVIIELNPMIPDCWLNPSLYMIIF